MPTWALIFLCGILSSCLSTPYALTEAENALPVDERLLGSWLNSGNGVETIDVAEAGPSEYDIHYRCIGNRDVCELLPAELRARGWVTEFAGRLWISLRGYDCDEDNSPICSSFIHAMVEIVDLETVQVALVTEAAEGVSSSSGSLREGLTDDIDSYLAEADVYLRAR